MEVLVALGVDDASLVLAHGEVEVHVIDHDVLVEAGDEDVAFAAELVLRGDEQAVVLAGVEAAEGSGGEGTGAAATHNLALLREVDVY